MRVRENEREIKERGRKKDGERGEERAREGKTKKERMLV